MTFTEYINQFPQNTQRQLIALRTAISSNFPEAVEGFAYGMPSFKLKKKPFVYFAAYKKHIGVYATPIAHEKFAEKLKNYKQGKGSVQFPLTENLPIDLLIEMLAFKASEIK